MTQMVSGNNIAEIAALIGDTTRANMLSALMDGRALTAGELAFHAGVSAQTTSGHLAKLLQGELIALEKQGRHRYYRLASPAVAEILEALMTLAANGPKRHRPTGPKDEAMRTARTCYDHMAGRLGIAIADSLSGKGFVMQEEGHGLISEEGTRFFCDFGIVLDGDTTSKRPLCRTCLDWSERRPHLAGRLGAALLARSLSLGWVSHVPQSRALRITRAGERGFLSEFSISASIDGKTASYGGDRSIDIAS
jgi:DNA-binding transcriptional ArsR family regulator